MKKILNKSTRKSRPVTKQAVLQMIEARTELKHVVGVTTGVPAIAGAMIYKSSIAQTDDYSGRTGDQIRIHEIKYTVSLVDTANNELRLIIVEDSEQYGASNAPTVGDILASATYTSQYNPILQANNRFKYLLDRRLDVSATGKQLRTVDGTIKMKGITSYVGTDAASASGGKNSIWALVIGFAATGGYTLTTSIAFRDA